MFAAAALQETAINARMHKLVFILSRSPLQLMFRFAPILGLSIDQDWREQRRRQPSTKIWPICAIQAIGSHLHQRQAQAETASDALTGHLSG